MVSLVLLEVVLSIVRPQAYTSNAAERSLLNAAKPSFICNIINNLSDVSLIIWVNYRVKA
jgi:hypothetical protein